MSDFYCNICDKEFKAKSGFNGHNFRVHSEKGKQCQIDASNKAAEMYKQGKITRGFIKGEFKHSLKTKNLMSQIRVESLNENAFYSKRTIYNGITLDSSYELKVAQELDENNIDWIRPKSLIWMDDGQTRRYIPDFYLLGYNVYLDPKNDYLIKKDARKISLAKEFNDVNIIVLDKNNLTWVNIEGLIGADSLVGKTPGL